MNYGEFNINTAYGKGDVVWFGELAFKAKRDMTIGISPEDKSLWKFYVRTYLAPGFEIKEG